MWNKVEENGDKICVLAASHMFLQLCLFPLLVPFFPTELCPSKTAFTVDCENGTLTSTFWKRHYVNNRK